MPVPAPMLPLPAPSPSASLAWPGFGAGSGSIEAGTGTGDSELTRKAASACGAGAGPLTRMRRPSKRAAARPGLAPTSAGPLLLASIGLQAREAASRWRRPAARVRRWKSKPAAHGPSLAPIVSARCWLAGRWSRRRARRQNCKTVKEFVLSRYCITSCLAGDIPAAVALGYVKWNSAG